ncbi:hypothetical protein RhiirB3_474369 [Rhizophagus irregularis]|nr:hypothetical protein RhiirB3_474369 [Rhizophagus irregularis]
MGPVVDSNEAMRCEYISTILHTAVSILGDLVITPQANIIGEENTGRVDYAIKKIISEMLEEIICITEGKQNQATIGICQNLLQCQSACDININMNKKKRKVDDAFDPDYDYVYGIVSTETDWELNAKLLAEIGELRKKFAEIKVKNDELKDKNTEIPELRRKFVEIEIERTELKAKIAELLKQGVEENKRRDAENAELKIRIEELEKNKADSSAKNVRRDVEITGIKAEIVKLRDNNEENKELIFLQSDNISKKMVSGNGQNNNTIDLNTNTMNSNTSEAPFGNIQVSDSVVDQLNNEVGQAVTSGDAPSDNSNTESLEDKKTDNFLDEVHKKKISDEIRERKQEEKLYRESIA